MKRGSLRCPKCYQVLAKPKSSNCPVCSRLIRVAEKTCCRFILEREKLNFGEVKHLLRNWPLSVQEEFVKAVAVFRINNPELINSSSGGR